MIVNKLRNAQNTWLNGEKNLKIYIKKIKSIFNMHESNLSVI